MLCSSVCITISMARTYETRKTPEVVMPTTMRKKTKDQYSGASPLSRPKVVWKSAPVACQSRQDDFRLLVDRLFTWMTTEAKNTGFRPRQSLRSPKM